MNSATRSTKYRWFVAILFFIISTIAAAAHANFDVALPFLRKQFEMTNTDAGGLSSLLLLTGLLLSIGFSAYMVYPMSFVSKEKFPVANEVVNMGCQLGGAATPWIVGMLLDSLGWDHVFGFMATISILTFMIVLTISEPLNLRET